VTVSDISDQFVIEAKNAIFPDGGCEGRRGDHGDSILQLPSVEELGDGAGESSKSDVTIWAGTYFAY